jgi:hypothetical protein
VSTLKPWAYGPFEILLHAEMHYRVGEDFDRRIAMIGFDNAIEVAVTTYLNLHPIQRGGKTYPNADVEKWLGNFHTKVEFFFLECAARTVAVMCKNDELVWYHEVRNGQYHVGGATVPQKRELDGVRAAAIEIFSILFGVADVSTLLEAHISARTPAVHARSDEDDKTIDGEHDMIDVCGSAEYPSDVLYALDPIRYRDIAITLRAKAGSPQRESEP